MKEELLVINKFYSLTVSIKNLENTN